MSGPTSGTPQVPQSDGDGISHGDGDGSAPHLNNRIMARRDAAVQADPHGRAALLLVESLLHALVAKGVLKAGEAIDIIDIAGDVESDLAGASDDARQSGETFLAPLAHTFRIERGD